jgi:transcription elongation factor Elf1
MTQPLKEAKAIYECTVCGTQSVWKTNNRVIYPDHTLYCRICGNTMHKRIKVGRWHLV